MTDSGEATRHSLFRSSTRSFSDGKLRPVCKFGTKCYRRNPEHLKAECHPYDPDYLESCRADNLTPDIVSIRSLFLWVDKSGTGKATRDEVRQAWDLIKKYGQDVQGLTDDMWNEIDDDGNGYVNFSEFAEFTTRLKLDLPLGLDELFDTNKSGSMRCGVYGCECREFKVRRRKCKYGENCYTRDTSRKTHVEHMLDFCHPGDADWEDGTKVKDTNMCSCGHKKQLHRSAEQGAGAVEYPSYWSSTVGEDNQEFSVLVDMKADEVSKFQTLLNVTYSDKTTRDRVNHTQSWMVPRDFKIKQVKRNENSKLWRKYCVRKAVLEKEKELADENAEEVKGSDLEYNLFVTDSSEAFEKMEGLGEDLRRDINEWYLFHGTSASAAENICKHDFKMRLAGSATGTLYGRGSYLAESITKADEYSKAQDGSHTVLLCRVLGGRVKYTAEREPDPNELTKACVEGPFDCIVGDRKKVSGTYREFIVFDTENVYPEYILKYERGELFKSESFPWGNPGAK